MTLYIKSVDPQDIRFKVTCPKCDKDNWVFQRDYIVGGGMSELQCVYCHHKVQWRLDAFTTIENKES